MHEPNHTGEKPILQQVGEENGVVGKGGGRTEPASVILRTSKGCRKMSGDLQRDAEEKEGGNVPHPATHTHNHFERAQSDKEEEEEEERQSSVTLSSPETQQLPLSGRSAIRQRPDLRLM